MTTAKDDGGEGGGGLGELTGIFPSVGDDQIFGW